MAIWYMRPTTTHSAIRDGTSYATAWGGFSEVVWGGAGVVGGDSLYWCGIIKADETNLSVGAHGGTSEVTKCIIRGDYPNDFGGLICLGEGYLNVNRAWTTISKLTIDAQRSRCINIGANGSDIDILECNLSANTTSGHIVLNSANGTNLSTIRIEGNTFQGTAGAPGVIGWYVSAAGALATLTRLTVKNNSFLGVRSSRAIVHLRVDPAADQASSITDLVVEDNTYTEVYGMPLEANNNSTLFGSNAGIRIARNRINTAYFAVGSTILGGNAIKGFGPSPTVGFGPNYIVGNELTNIQGQYGGFNLFHGRYFVSDNLIDTIYTETIDGNGILLDHGNEDTVITRNTIKNIFGRSGINNSGAAVMLLDSIRCRIQGNLFENIAQAIFVGAKQHVDTGGIDYQSAKIYNNTAIECKNVGMKLSSTSATDLDTRNNVFTGPGVAVVSGVVWTTENYNNFYGMLPPTGHTFGINTVTTDPKLLPEATPWAGSTVIGAGEFVGYGTDLRGKQFWSPPSIGAIEYERPRASRN